MAGGGAPSSSKPRGELGELSAQLQGLCTKGKRTDKEMVAAKREVFKKVINYMTLGMDMSALFPMMISCANLSADDVVLKKQLYLYITHYAASTPDLALLTINQLQKDCRDQDPTVRGLALRSLCSLRIPNLLEYVVQPVVAGLGDRHAYVRRTAAMGVLKVLHMSPGTVAAAGMADAARRLLAADPDPQVFANCLQLVCALDPIEKLAGDKAFVYGLINRLKELSEWAQCRALEVVAHYKPANEAEVFDILNALEDRLGSVNSAVVVAAMKVFLIMTLGMPATHQQVLERVKDPLKTLVARDEPAAAYAVLCHARLLVARAPILFEVRSARLFFLGVRVGWGGRAVFVCGGRQGVTGRRPHLSSPGTKHPLPTQNQPKRQCRQPPPPQRHTTTSNKQGDYQAFFCRSHDPWYIKQLKMEVLTLMASAANAYDVVAELAEYARDPSPATGRAAVRAVGRVARALPDASGVVERLLGFLEAGAPHLVAEALVQLKDLLRRYPDLASVVGSLSELRPARVAEPEARAALVWILGQFGEHVAGAQARPPPGLLCRLLRTWRQRAGC